MNVLSTLVDTFPFHSCSFRAVQKLKYCHWPRFGLKTQSSISMSPWKAQGLYGIMDLYICSSEFMWCEVNDIIKTEQSISKRAVSFPCLGQGLIHPYYCRPGQRFPDVSLLWKEFLMTNKKKKVKPNSMSDVFSTSIWLQVSREGT